MEPKTFTMEHNIYKDKFSRATYQDPCQSPQRIKRNDEASPTKRKFQQIQTSSGCIYIKNESFFSHEQGQVVENSCQLLHRLSRLFKNSELSDIRLIVVSGTDDKKEYPAHKLVLCSASEVFKVMLTGRNWNEFNMSEICLNEDPLLGSVFEIFLEYLYSGRIILSHSTVLNVLMLADKYDVKDLQEVCINYMYNHLVSTVEQNRAVSWLQYGRFAGHKYLANECEQFICWNFYKVISSPDFLCMEFDLLLFFLKQSDMVIPDEFILYQGIVQWWLGDQNNDGNDMGSNFKNSDGNTSCFLKAHELFSFIRFPLMTHTQLNAITSDVVRFQQFDNLHESSHNKKLNVLLIVVDEFARKALMLQDVAKSAMKYADFCNFVKNKFDESQLTLRNYTNEIWSTTLCIDKFSCLPQHEIRSVVFSSPSSSLLPDESSHVWDWTVEFFPKGVVFQRCIMIGLWRNVEVHGDIYNTVRLALHCNQSKEFEKGQRNVMVCVLVTGVQDNVEHICRVEKRSMLFDGSDRTRHINDLVPFQLLNQSPHMCRSNSSINTDNLSPCMLLCGPEGDSLKITIVIKPSSAFYFNKIHLKNSQST